MSKSKVAGIAIIIIVGLVLLWAGSQFLLSVTTAEETMYNDLSGEVNTGILVPSVVPSGFSIGSGGSGHTVSKDGGIGTDRELSMEYMHGEMEFLIHEKFDKKDYDRIASENRLNNRGYDPPKDTTVESTHMDGESVAFWSWDDKVVLQTQKMGIWIEIDATGLDVNAVIAIARSLELYRGDG